MNPLIFQTDFGVQDGAVSAMLEYAERAVVFSDGRVIANDTSANILTDASVIERASLKETSLYELALRCELPESRAFVQRFIDYDREVRGR